MISERVGLALSGSRGRHVGLPLQLGSVKGKPYLKSRAIALCYAEDLILQETSGAPAKAGV